MNAAIIWIKPIASTGLDPTRSAEELHPMQCRLWQLSGERARGAIGIFTSGVYKCRFRVSRSADPGIVPGWRARDMQGAEYEVRAVVNRMGLYDITLERS